MTHTTTSFHSEAWVETQIRKYLNTLKPHIWFVKHGQYGVPDRLVCYKGFFLAIEVKNSSPSSKCTPKQQQNSKEIERAGGWFVEAHSVEDVKQIIAAMDSHHDWITASLDNGESG